MRACLIGRLISVPTPLHTNINIESLRDLQDNLYDVLRMYVRKFCNHCVRTLLVGV